MKTIFLTFFLTAWMHGFGQDFQIHSSHGDTINNWSSKVFVTPFEFDSLTLESTNGKISPFEKNQFLIRWALPGLTIIKGTVYISGQAEAIFDTLVLVDVNNYSAQLSHHSGSGSITKAELMGTVGLIGQFGFD